MAEVDQAAAARTELLGAPRTDAPVVVDRRVESWLVQLVFEEHLPVVRQLPEHLAQAPEVPVERSPKVLLAGVVSAVTDPHGQRLGAELLADLDALAVVLDGLLAHRWVGVRQTAELVRVLLSGLVLEGVRVDGVEAQAEFFRECLELGGVLGLVPGEVERNPGRDAGQLVHDRAVVQLLEDVAGLARLRKAREPRAARAHAQDGSATEKVLACWTILSIAMLRRASCSPRWSKSLASSARRSASSGARSA